MVNPTDTSPVPTTSEAPQPGRAVPESPRPGTPLHEVRDWLAERMDDGESCPCCGQLAKVYRRKIHSVMARDLITAYRAHGTDWFHLRSTVGHQGGDFAKLAYWDLIAEMPAVRDDGSSRAGWWRVTADGVMYVRGGWQVQKYARIYDGECIGFDGDHVGIRDALGERFRYDDLMAGV